MFFYGLIAHFMLKQQKVIVWQFWTLKPRGRPLLLWTAQENPSLPLPSFGWLPDCLLFAHGSWSAFVFTQCPYVSLAFIWLSSCKGSSQSRLGTHCTSHLNFLHLQYPPFQIRLCSGAKGLWLQHTTQSTALL